jgi:hypothetical protein
MTPDNFILWLKGFTNAVGDDYPTSLQWGIITEQLAKVNKEKGIHFVTAGTGISTTLGRNDITYKTEIPTTKTILND